MVLPRHIMLTMAAIMCLWCAFMPNKNGCATVHDPVWAGKFYPETKGELEQLLHTLFSTAEKEDTAKRPSSGLCALIMPHAGYIYSGLTAAHAAGAIPRDGFDRVVLMGPDHRVGFANASLTRASHWRTPLGKVPVGDTRQLEKSFPDLFARVVASDRSEHSIEVILPFLQNRLSRFELLPVVVGPCDPKKMANAVSLLLHHQRTLLVVSADLSHYLPYEEAVKRDQETLERILAMDPDWDRNQSNRTCGRYPIGVLLELARRNNWNAVILHYNNSGDTAGDKSAVVGYAAVAFYGDESMKQSSDNQALLTPEQGEALTSLVRKTLVAHFSTKPDLIDDPQLADPALQARCGTFVTLKMNNQLRGCIGSLSSDSPIVTGVRDNALNAAFHDPRFRPLRQNELEAVEIEVSVLTDPVPLEYTDADDLLSKLNPGVDGVILRKGPASATFLPQVWEQLPRPETFLSRLCTKAGLPSDQWREGDLSISVYRVQYFEEDR